MRSVRGQDGVGLIEVLIALLVLSFGMLGLAGLQLWSLKNNQSSMERSLAVVQTHSIIDAMRADRTTATTGGFNVNVDTAGAVPTGGTFARSSVAAWKANLVGALGDGAVGGVECNGDRCTVRVRWNDQRAAAAGSSTDQQASTLQEIATEVRL
jgi:type IV pilus assembly protein PilV